MKPLTFLSIILVMGKLPMAAQNVTIQHENAPVEFYRLPDRPLDPAFTTYSVELDASSYELSKAGLYESSLIDQYLQLEGFREVASGGHVRIEARIGEFFIWNEARKTSTTKVKNKEGKTETRHRYYIELRYSLPLTLEVQDKSGRDLLEEDIFRSGDIQTWTSTYHNSMSDLESYWRVQRNSRLKDLHADRIKAGMKQIRDRINFLYGYPVIEDQARFETIGRKSHPDHDRFMAEVEKIKQAFVLMRADKEVLPVKTKLQPVIQFYINEEKLYKPGNKNTDRLKHICLYNLALMHFWVEELDEAEMYAKRIQLFDSRDRDARRMLDDIDTVRSAMSRNGVQTRHGPRIARA